MSKQLGITVKKEEDFSEWYTQVIQKAGLADYAPVGGCMVIKPLGFGIWENIQKVLDKKFKETGVKNAYFPMLIPERLLKREAKHFSGFVPECGWVTHGGDSKLSERLALRPTSETIMYEVFSKWIRSYRDLPLLINQWCNIIRWETKATKLFLRTREFLWQEGHTVHRTKNEANERMKLMLKIYKDFVEKFLAIPLLDGEKSEKEKFAGALTTTTIEALMPDGKALQMGTSHNLGQNFSKAFEITFLDKDGREKYAWQTSWGVSTRLIGALVMVHGDDKGLVLPPKISPIQVVIVPIRFKENANVLKVARKIKQKLEEANYSVVLDERVGYTAGWKFNDWELRGVPIRIEIGPEELKTKRLTLFRRDTREKKEIDEERVVDEIKSMLDDIQSNLFKRAKKFLDENITTVKGYEEFKRVVSERGGFIRACWCSSPKCEEKIKNETGATIRMIPFKKEKVFSNCIYCGKKANKVVYFAKAY